MFISKIISIYRRLKKDRLLKKKRASFKKFKKFGINNDIHIDTTFYYHERIQIGSYIYIGPGAEINGLGEIDIKDGVIIGPNITIHSANHRFKDAKYIPYDEEFDFRKVEIGENVWIGGNVILVPGTVIGEGCIIGAGTVVSGTIPPLSVVIGNPCKIIKKRNEEHYFKLKEEGQIYLKYKFQMGIRPQIDLP